MPGKIYYLSQIRGIEWISDTGVLGLKKKKIIALVPLSALHSDKFVDIILLIYVREWGFLLGNFLSILHWEEFALHR